MDEAEIEKAAQKFVDTVKVAEKFPHEVLAALYVITHVFLETNYPEAAKGARAMNDTFIEGMKEQSKRAT